MNHFLGVLGQIVVFGYVAKIAFQIYLKRINGEEINTGAGNVFGWDFFKPIKQEVSNKLKPLKQILNLIHALAVIYLILLFAFLALRK
ncbi:MAG: hypothetical protein QM725_09100 [Lacibacter sp.]